MKKQLDDRKMPAYSQIQYQKKVAAMLTKHSLIFMIY